MTVAEILEQAKTLSPVERIELVKLLVDSLGVSHEVEIEAEHWGQTLNQLMASLEPIEMKYPEIEDPVAWVKHLRSEQRHQRLGDWDDDE